MTYIVTYVDVEPVSADRGIALIRQYCRSNIAGDGNVSTLAMQEGSRPNRFVIVELWASESSLEPRDSAEHTNRFRSELKAIHNSPYDQRVHQAFAVGNSSQVAASDAVHLVTHVDVPPPRRDETEALLRVLAEQSRQEEGNLRYDVFQQQAPRTNHFTVFAVWKDESAFASHERKPHTRNFREALGPMLGAPYDERIYRLLELPS